MMLQASSAEALAISEAVAKVLIVPAASELLNTISRAIAAPVSPAVA